MPPLRPKPSAIQCKLTAPLLQQQAIRQQGEQANGVLHDAANALATEPLALRHKGSQHRHTRTTKYWLTQHKVCMRPFQR